MQTQGGMSVRSWYGLLGMERASDFVLWLEGEVVGDCSGISSLPHPMILVRCRPP